ncbi:inositol monophosphatase family protein [Nocardioides marmoribigeumensis]|uniref:Fructose-1,6-bisphosphatase/inositol monophosphatase family enzyme n=1 Tax=Nocardioides marmoribigeumensis TaxID=433649 RepID=A0ABU2BQI0_9ACTN|nr:inositol monophosphatase [Nocardioides marmoribigeumensis]MDR7360893.1 fructose-1,6-bisphosphatase/inositol monophosphatase family enzyme [Nocardioides marmoribigeumensis]
METDEVLRLLQDVAAEVVNPRFRSLDEAEIAEKQPGDLVTAADHESEELLTAALLEAYPDAVVLGEEAYATDPHLIQRFVDAEHAFTVDPVDGTRNFVHGSPDHAVMCAEVVGGETTRAWVWQPQHETAYVAERGGGTWRNGERLTRPPVVGDPVGATSRRRWRTGRLGDLPQLRNTWWCCGVDYPHLIEGDTDYLLYGHPKPWDHAPTGLLVTEAGGVVGDLEGNAYTAWTHTSLIVAAADRTTYDRVRQAVAADSRLG